MILPEIYKVHGIFALQILDASSGYFVLTTCNIIEAILEYNVELDGKTVTLNNPSLKIKVVDASNSLGNDSAGTTAGLCLANH